MNNQKLNIEYFENSYWYSFLRKANDPEWGDSKNQHEISKKILDYFKNRPIDEDIKKELNSLINSGDDEILRTFSVIMDFDCRDINYIFDTFKKFKRSRAENIEESFIRFKNLIIKFRSKNNQLIDCVGPHIEEDIKNRQSNIEADFKNISNIIDFFRPKETTTNQREITFLTTDFLLSRNEGCAIPLIDKVLILSSVDNFDNRAHEFCHTIINPITDKIKLTDEQNEKIINAASNNLKYEQGYGRHVLSLLNETLIRTYTNFYSKNRKPKTIEEFKAVIYGLNEEQFNYLLYKESIKERFFKLGIRNLDGLKEKYVEYYNLHEKNELRDRCYELLESYSSHRKDNNTCFEDYFIENYRNLFRMREIPLNSDSKKLEFSN